MSSSTPVGLGIENGANRWYKPCCKTRYRPPTTTYTRRVKRLAVPMCAFFFSLTRCELCMLHPKSVTQRRLLLAIRVRAMFARSQHILPPPSPVRPSPCSGNNFFRHTVKVVFVVRTVMICAHRLHCAARRTARGRIKAVRLTFFAYCARYKST